MPSQARRGDRDEHTYGTSGMSRPLEGYSNLRLSIASSSSKQNVNWQCRDIRLYSASVRIRPKLESMFWGTAVVQEEPKTCILAVRTHEHEEGYCSQRDTKTDTAQCQRLQPSSALSYSTYCTAVRVLWTVVAAKPPPLHGFHGSWWGSPPRPPPHSRQWRHVAAQGETLAQAAIICTCTPSFRHQTRRHRLGLPP